MAAGGSKTLSRKCRYDLWAKPWTYAIAPQPYVIEGYLCGNRLPSRERVLKPHIALFLNNVETAYT